MAKTLQYLRRIAESHKTDHALCDIDVCEAARAMAAEETPADFNPDSPVDRLIARYMEDS